MRTSDWACGMDHESRILAYPLCTPCKLRVQTSRPLKRGQLRAKDSEPGGVLKFQRCWRTARVYRCRWSGTATRHVLFSALGANKEGGLNMTLFLVEVRCNNSSSKSGAAYDPCFTRFANQAATSCITIARHGCSKLFRFHRDLGHAGELQTACKMNV